MNIYLNKYEYLFKYFFVEQTSSLAKYHYFLQWLCLPFFAKSFGDKVNFVFTNHYFKRYCVGKSGIHYRVVITNQKRAIYLLKGVLHQYKTASINKVKDLVTKIPFAALLLFQYLIYSLFLCCLSLSRKVGE